jgi:purine-nucleoside/S-methyl-5'-thioadenosine phosphorylase / adenosine deaminase
VSRPAIDVLVPDPFRIEREHVAIELPGAHVVFTTRRGGVSSGPYESLNLGFLTDDERAAVAHNRASLAESLGVRFAYGRQVHGTYVRTATAASDEGTMPEEADGTATSMPGVAPMVLTADCLPIAIAGDGVVAMVHAGWRGLAEGVIAEAVSAVRALGASGPLAAAIGPGAGPCCYEVGDEVRSAFYAEGPDVRSERNLDLKAIASRQLERSGVSDVHDLGLCTICADPSLFFSHRRDDGLTGRQAGVAWLS